MAEPTLKGKMGSCLNPNVARSNRMRWTRARVVSEIRAKKARGESLAHMDVRRSAKPLLNAACRYCGSWSAALDEAGLLGPWYKPHRQWTKTTICEEIRRLHQAGVCLRWSSVFAINARLAGSAVHRRYFGSWRAALAAAGVDDPRIRPRKRWTKERVVKEILDISASGRMLNWCSLTKTHGDLIYAGRRLYGSWWLALEAAGLEPSTVYRKKSKPAESAAPAPSGSPSN